MSERFVVLPAWMVRDGTTHDDPHAAAVAASQLVSKDSTPRVVVKLCSEITKSIIPSVDIVQIEERGP